MLRVARDAAASRPSRDADIDRGRPAQSSDARQAASRVARDTSAARSAASAPIIAENDDRGRFCQSPAALKLHCARPRAWSPLARRATRISTEAVPPNRPSRGKQRCAWRGTRPPLARLPLARPPLAQPQARRSTREYRPRPALPIVRRLEAALRVASGATVALRISSACRHRSVARRATIPPGRSRLTIRPPVR